LYSSNILIFLIDFTKILAIIMVISPLWGEDKKMRFITVSELRGNATRIVHEVEETGEEVVITRNGHPVALIRKVEEDEFILKGGRAEGGSNGES